MKRIFLLTAVAWPVLFHALPLLAADINGWSTESPREEIRPQFSTGQNGSLIVAHDDREGLDGWFQRTFPIKGGDFYRFEVRRKISNVAAPRQSCLVRICWKDDSGRMVSMDERPARSDPRLPMPSAEPEYPRDQRTDSEG